MSVCVVFQGGIGNQMFQYAFGMALEEQGREVQYDFSRVDVGGGEGPHVRSYPSFGLYGFNIKDIKSGLSHSPVYDCKGQVGYDPEALNVKEGTLSGYWQSEKYFVDPMKMVNTFFPSTPVSEYIRKLSVKIAGNDSVAVQVRRGDYLMCADYHGVMNRDYFLRGIEATGKKDVFIFTDDSKWCEENLPGEVVSTGSRQWNIALMAGCNSAVISNSSFGWWGAWLGDHNFIKPGRAVVAPVKWFANPEVKASDLVPSRWSRL